MNKYTTLYYSSLSTALTGVVAVLPGLASSIRLLSLMIMFILLIISTLQSVRLCWYSRPMRNWGWIIISIFIVAGGAVFDIAMTVHHSPDLSMEANPIARMLFDVGMKLPHVYLIGITAQIFLVVFVVSLFSTFLSQRGVLLNNINQKGYTKIIVQLFTGPGGSWSDFFLGRVNPQYAVLFMAPLLVVLFVYRWYLGLEWLHIVPISRVLVPIILFSVAFFIVGLIGCKKNR